MKLSRRDFFKFSGVMLGGLSLPNAFDALPTPSDRGRILAATVARMAPDHQAPSAAHLRPDSLQRIHAIEGAWARLAAGYVPAQDVQPMLAPGHPAQVPGWAEVGAPFAALRRYASPDAPIVARVGHGAVLSIDRSLGADWLHVTEPDAWVQAVHVQAAPPPRRNPAPAHIGKAIHCTCGAANITWRAWTP